MLLTRLEALALFVIAGAVGCGDPPPAKAPQREEGVPANSLSDARLHGEEPGDEASAPGESKEDPTQPYTQKVGEAPVDPTPSGGKGGARGGGAEPSTGGKGAATRYECDRVMDRYLELEIAQNPQLRGVPPEVIEQAKQMARDKHGEAPCTATRAQYSCAMAAASTGAWQKCMK